jgi:hypothetical protein
MRSLGCPPVLWLPKDTPSAARANPSATAQAASQCLPRSFGPHPALASPLRFSAQAPPRSRRRRVPACRRRGRCSSFGCALRCPREAGNGGLRSSPVFRPTGATSTRTRSPGPEVAPRPLLRRRQCLGMKGLSPPLSVHQTVKALA